MKFELKGFDVTYSKEKHTAIVSKDENAVMGVDFDEDTDIFNIVAGVALMMAFDGLLSEEDIKSHHGNMRHPYGKCKRRAPADERIQAEGSQGKLKKTVRVLFPFPEQTDSA